MKIKTGDTVQIITGAHKGTKGKVLRVLVQEERVIIEGANMVKRHKKATRRGQEQGIIEKPAPIHVSNVMLVDASTKIPTRVGFDKDESGKKRVAKKTKKTVDK